MIWRKKKSPQRYSEEQQPASSNAIIWMLGALLLVVAPHLWRQPLWIAGICLTILAWRLVKEIRGWALPSTLFRILLAGSLLAATYLHYKTLNGLDAGTALLTLMLCLKLVELRSMRDATIILLLAYFLVLSGFLYDQSIFSGLYLMLVVLLLTTVLLVLNHPGNTFSSHKRAYLKNAGALLIQALPLMLILFILVPRIPGPLWSLPSNSSSGKTGLSDEMSIGDISHLADSNEVAFRATFDGEIPLAEQLYWRGPILWKTDGRNWNALEESDLFSQLPAPSFISHSPPVEYQVTLQPNNQRWLFALDLPLLSPEKSFLRRDFQLLHKDKISEVYRYSMSSVLDYQNNQLHPQERALALQLPKQRNPQTLALAQQWQQQMNEKQRVAYALNYFRQQPFYYSRTPPKLPGNDPIDQFLFNAQKGFCEHYAAAFTTLMRASGIPARVVTGYQGGEYNELGDYLVVRQSDAHAWAEVWLDEEGWLRVDPTSVIPKERVEAYNDLQRFMDTRNDALFNPDTTQLYRSWLHAARHWDAVNHQWNQWVLGFDQNKQQQLLQRLGLGELNIASIIGLMMLILITLLGLLLLYLLYQQQKNSDPLQQAYQQLCQRLSKRGVDIPPWLGPQQCSTRAMQQLPLQRHEIKALFQHYIALRYQKGKKPASQQQFIRAAKRFR